jgi:hypothetical protein
MLGLGVNGLLIVAITLALVLIRPRQVASREALQS